MSTWFRITFASGEDRTIPGSNARDAADRAERERNSPIYCRLHAGMPEAQRSAPVGDMGFYTPRPVVAVSAERMTEGYCNGGMAVWPTGEVTQFVAELDDADLDEAAERSADRSFEQDEVSLWERF